MNGQAFACIRLDRQGAALSCFASSSFPFALALHEANDMRRKTFAAIRVFLQKENPAYRTAGFSSRPGLEGRHQRNLNAPSGRWFRGRRSRVPTEVGDRNKSNKGRNVDECLDPLHAAIMRRGQASFLGPLRYSPGWPIVSIGSYLELGSTCKGFLKIDQSSICG